MKKNKWNELILKSYVTFVFILFGFVALHGQDTIYSLKPPFKIPGEVIKITPIETLYRSKRSHKILTTGTMNIRYITDVNGKRSYPQKTDFEEFYDINPKSPKDTIVLKDSKYPFKIGFICDETPRLLIIGRYSKSKLIFEKVYKDHVLMVLHGDQYYSHPSARSNYVSSSDQINSYGLLGKDTIYFKSNPTVPIPCKIVGYNVDEFESDFELEFEIRTSISIRSYRSFVKDIERSVDGEKSISKPDKTKILDKPPRTIFKTSAEKKGEEDNRDSLKIGFTKNSIYIDVFALASKTLTLGYERSILKGHIVLRMPISIGLSNSSPTNTEIFMLDMSRDEFLRGAVGLDILVYPRNQYRAVVLFGIGGGLQATEGEKQINEVDQNGNLTGVSNTKRFPYEYFFLKTYFGPSFNIVKHFNVTLLGYIGAKERRQENNFSYGIGGLELNLKYQF